MKRLFWLALLLAPVALRAQDAYWQQRADTKINVALNDSTHSLSGTIAINYTNNAPASLESIWFHLWPNAYQNEKTAFAKQLLRDKAGKARLAGITDKGWIDSLHFEVNGKPARLEYDKENAELARLILPQPLKTGESIVITTPFHVKLPTFSSRSGHIDNTYMVCQWYPKPAVYDRKGWHPLPYLDQGEFYNEIGNYDVSITLPADYIVGASGTLQTTAELDQYKAIGTARRAGGSRPYLFTPGKKTLRFTGENLPDFAWFADKSFLIEYDTLQLASGRIVDVFSYHHPDGNPTWKNSTSYIKSGVRSYSAWIGEYGYPVVAAVEGPKNESSGGMEYPMITLITSPDADELNLDAVITHEVGHNWFPMMIPTNERDHAWMDEGINTYYQFRYEAYKYRNNILFGAQIPAELRKKPAADFLDAIYSALGQLPSKEPIDQTATKFPSKDDYAIVVYIKTALWMHVMEKTLGREALEKAIQDYFTEWKFRHPYPEDFKASLERSLQKDLTALFKLLDKKGSF
ncbi:MAG: peptidase [Flaviaesturariibacter sp.]|nr:peptidase [Flaviaesturariibacter sp.]